jgi:hypothetical protein
MHMVSAAAAAAAAAAGMHMVSAAVCCIRHLTGGVFSMTPAADRCPKYKKTGNTRRHQSLPNALKTHLVVSLPVETSLSGLTAAAAAPALLLQQPLLLLPLLPVRAAPAAPAAALLLQQLLQMHLAAADMVAALAVKPCDCITGIAKQSNSSSRSSFEQRATAQP